MRKWQGGSLVVATHNAGKVFEINELLVPYGVDAVSSASLGLGEPDETEPDFKGNALLKARAAAKVAGLPALADDSGLAVEALNGAPGIFSARWAGPDKDFALAMKRVEGELAALNAPSQRAAFICALAMVWPDGYEVVFEGRVEGTLTFPPRGVRGFGYDPIFVPEGFHETFGEMDQVLKHAMSHRARAFAQLVAACFH